MPTKTPTKPARTTTKPAAPRLTLAAVMTALEQAGSAQARKTYLRHGAVEPMFGVSFATLKTMTKRIKVDHELALALWATGNFDARNLAVKIAGPAQMTPSELDRWARELTARMCRPYVAHLAAEGAHALSRAELWLAAADETMRGTGWSLVAAMARVHEDTPDAWFGERLSDIEAAIATAPNAVREAMLDALIAIGGRSTTLRASVTAACERIGPIAVDHGDTACGTPEVVPTLEKTWAHSLSKGCASPAAQERTRASMRTRC